MNIKYIANDGTEFDSKKECKEYEENTSGNITCVFCGGPLIHRIINGEWGYTRGYEYVKCETCHTIIKRECPTSEETYTKLMRDYRRLKIE